MMSKAENDRLCRIGPDTPMGKVFRRFWNPICTSAELPHPDCAPIAAKHLGQDLVVFRNSEGKVGVLDEYCMHRGASLALGRVEDCGIRCIYHGWKFAVDGTIQEIMNNNDPRLKARMKAKAYPVHEAAGLIWTYLGDPTIQPELPRYKFLDYADVVVQRIDTNVNWVQAAEGGLDSSHVSVLHSNASRPGWSGATTETVGAWADTAPTYEIEDTTFGYHYAAFRKGSGDKPDNVRVVPFAMPSCRIIPDITGNGNATWVFEIPIDDENTSTFFVRYGPYPLPADEHWKNTGFDDPEFYSFATHRFLFSRKMFSKQKRHQMDKLWTGFRGVALEDAVITTSMGPIYDRSQEHLIGSDIAVVRFRRRLLESVNLVEQGQEPIGFGADYSKVTAIDAPMPKAEHWRMLVPEHEVVA